MNGDADVGIDNDLIVKMKFVGHVLGSCDQIISVVTYQDHVIGRSRDHNITLINPIGFKDERYSFLLMDNFM